MGKTSEARADNWIEEGLARQQNGDFDGAAECFSQALAVRPGDRSAVYFLGCLESDRGRHQAAVRHLQVAAREPDFLQAHVALGDELLLLGRWKLAAASFRKALALDPTSAESWNSLGIALHRGGKQAAAAEAFESALERCPEHDAPLFGLGVAQAELHRYEAAAKTLEHVVERAPGHAEAWYRLGHARLSLDNLAPEAEIALRKAIALQPEYPEARLALGVSFERQGRTDEAVAEYEEVAQKWPNLLEALARIAFVRVEQGNLAKAVAGLEETGRFRKEDRVSLLLRSDRYSKQSRFEDAIVFCLMAAACDPESADPYYAMGYSLAAMKRLKDAESCYRLALDRRSDWPEVQHNLASALTAQYRYEEAVPWCVKALEGEPDNVEALRTLALCQYETGKLESVVETLERLICLRPKDSDALCRLGVVQHRLGLEEAEETVRSALAIKPDNEDAQQNLGVMLAAKNRIDEAIEILQPAADRNPDNADMGFNLAICILKRGDWAEGWRRYESRLRIARVAWRKLEGPQWDGEPMPGKTLLVAPEQGLGDVLQFVRYLPMAKERSGARILFECQAELMSLLKSCDGFDEIVQRAPDFSTPTLPYDAHIPLLSLPYLFGTDESSIPADVPYLDVDAERKAAWRDKLADCRGLKVGLRWGGNTNFPGDRTRSCRLADLAPLAGVKGVTFISLQQDNRAEETANPPEGMEIRDFSGDLTDFTETAALISSLDLVVSTCTSVLHLAGGMGASSWAALSFDADWRWLMDREDSPWYPTMRLFRQRRQGDWGFIFSEMATELAKLAVSARAA
jgi:tetratricopeptide (TPR) repeat protein